MKKIEIVPSVDTQRYLEFDCREKKDRVISSLKIKNHGETDVVRLEDNAGIQAHDYFYGLIHGQTWNRYDLSKVRFNYHNSPCLRCDLTYIDPSKVKEIEKQKFSLSLLELQFPVDSNELNAHIKQNKSQATTHVFDVSFGS